MPANYFTPNTFKFLRELKANNERPWFQENKSRFDGELKKPALDFILDFGQSLMKISPHFRADPRPVGGSLFRIYRDVRFSKNKDPYKTHAGLHFRHAAGKTAHTPGFYLHLEPGASFAGLGIWRPDGPTVKMIREAIVKDPQGWTKAVGGKAFTKTYTISGAKLKRPPKGFDPEHPLVETLKFKDFTAFVPLTQKQITGPDFLKEYAALCKVGAPMVEFICNAIGQPFK